MTPPVAFVTPNRGGIRMEPFVADAAVGLGFDASPEEKYLRQTCCVGLLL